MSAVLVEGDRVLVRRFTRDDLIDLVGYRTDPDVARYQDWDTDWGMADAERYLPSDDDPALGTPGRWEQLAVIDTASGDLCGDIGVHFLADQPATVEIGVTMAPRFQGQGLAADAVGSVVSLVFRAFAAHRVLAHVDARNAEARRLLDRLGFRQEAELKDADWFKGEWTTLCIYAVLVDEWVFND